MSLDSRASVDDSQLSRMTTWPSRVHDAVEVIEPPSPPTLPAVTPVHPGMWLAISAASWPGDVENAGAVGDALEALVDTMGFADGVDEQPATVTSTTAAASRTAARFMACSC